MKMIQRIFFIFATFSSLRSRSATVVKDGFLVHRRWKKTNIDITGTSITEFLATEDPETFPSLTSAKKAVRRGLVYINGNCAVTTDIIGPAVEVQIELLQRVSQGNFIAQNFERGASLKLARGGFLVPVLWEDDQLAVVLKPQGMPVFKSGMDGGKTDASSGDHQGGNNGELSCSCLQSALPYSLSPVTATATLDGQNAVNMLRRPQPVHRLDKETGGLLLVAKTKPALVALSAQFTTRVVKKRYLALTVSAASAPAAGALSGLIDTPLGGQHALTSYAFADPAEPSTQEGQNGDDKEEDMGAVCRRTAVASEQGDDDDDVWGDGVFSQVQTPSACRPPPLTPYGYLSTVHLTLHTGRTHQIRRHLDSLQFPILGDPKYYFSDGGRSDIGSTLSSESNSGLGPESDFPPDLGLGPVATVPLRRLLGEGVGMALYSVGISFLHPVQGDRITVQIPEPCSFKRLRGLVLGERGTE